MLSFKLNLLANNTTVGRTRPTVKNTVINTEAANKMKPDVRRAELSFEKLDTNQQEQKSCYPYLNPDTDRSHQSSHKELL